MSSRRSRIAGQPQANHVEAVVEVLAEESQLHARLEVLVRGGDHAHVRGERRVPTDAVVVAVREHAQEPRLQVGRHVADLVEEERPALGLLEAPAAHRLRAGEGPSFMAEELALQEVFRDRGGVDRDERLGRSRAVAVQRPRDELLAGARFPRDEDGRMRLREAPDRAEHLLHRRRLPEDLRCFHVRRGELHVPAVFLERAAHEPHRVVDVEGLREVFERPALEGGHRAVEVRVRRHDDDRGRREARLELLHELEARRARHANVAHDDLRGLEGQPVERFLRAPEGAVEDALARERLLEHPADRAVVVDDPDGVGNVLVRHHEAAFVLRSRTGRSTVKRVCPGTLSNSMIPSCWPAYPCASARPSPVPPSRPLTRG
jgi:hypothetical protein